MKKLSYLILLSLSFQTIAGQCDSIDKDKYPEERRMCQDMYEAEMKERYKKHFGLEEGSGDSRDELSQCEFQEQNSKIVCADGSVYRKTDDVVEIGRGFSESGIADFLSNDQPQPLFGSEYKIRGR